MVADTGAARNHPQEFFDSPTELDARPVFFGSGYFEWEGLTP
jgi:hypothetical protein